MNAALQILIAATSEAAAAQRVFIKARKDLALGRCTVAAVLDANDKYENKASAMFAAQAAAGIAD